MAALAKITDEALLADLSESAASKTTRRLAAEKIAEIERPNGINRTTEEILAKKLHALAAEAARLQTSPDHGCGGAQIGSHQAGMAGPGQ